MQYYESRNPPTGNSGGLGLLMTDAKEYDTWACIHAPMCTFVTSDDMACFKYSKFRGEFHFWNWNSRIKVSRELFLLEARFCDRNMRSTLIDARSSVGEGQVCVCVCIYLCMYACLCVCIYVFMYACMHACMHIYIYIYYIYTHTYLCI